MGRKKKDFSDIRSKNVCFILYPDNDKHLEILKILESGKYNAVWIKHDLNLDRDPESLDASDEGYNPKVHYHCIIRFVNAHWFNALASELGIEYNLLQPCNNVLAYMHYCLHVDFPDRGIYLADDFCGNSKTIEDFKLYLEKNIGFNERFDFLLDYINNFEGILSWLVFVNYARQHNKRDILAKNTYLWKSLVDTHNYEYREAYQHYKSNPFD